VTGQRYREPLGMSDLREARAGFLEALDHARTVEPPFADQRANACSTSARLSAQIMRR
jgi:hypothetical protein